ncbi:MAG: hypothetical protein H7175_12100 [Burkholderiales bacterium]|nr:hypothetical protein [Anaerolineae bacterium]
MQQTQGWHVANWGLWGWLETIIKFVGIVAAYAAFFASSGDLIVGGNPELGAVIIVALATLITIVAITIRIRQREVISMVYALLNFLAHVGLVIALLRVPTQTTLPLVFAVAFVIGELVKQYFLKVTGYTEQGQDIAGMIRFSRIVMSAYILLVIALII